MMKYFCFIAKRKDDFSVGGELWSSCQKYACKLQQAFWGVQDDILPSGANTIEQQYYNPGGEYLQRGNVCTNVFVPFSSEIASRTPKRHVRQL